MGIWRTDLFWGGRTCSVWGMLNLMGPGTGCHCPRTFGRGTASAQKESSPQTGGHPEDGAEHFQREPQGSLPLRVQSKACKLQPGLRSFICTQLRPFACLSLAAFQLQQPRGVVESETIWLTKPKIFTLWPFTEKVCQS